MEWSRDLESGGDRFDSRLPEVRSGSLFRHFGMSWEVSGSGLGTFSDGFGIVLKKISDNVGKSTISYNGREYFS